MKWMKQKLNDNLLRKFTQTYKLEIKGFCKNIVPLRKSTITYTSPHRSMISSESEKGKQTYNFKIICNTFLDSASHKTTTKIKAMHNNMPLEGPGTGLVDPCIHSDPTNSKVAKQSVANHSY